jgi:Raf kinase inhibitor-like YbhB/YbcL family protein
MAGSGLAAAEPARLEVKSPAVTEAGALALNFTAYGRSISPPISWSAGPARTKTYAIIVVDPDSRFPKPGVQWVVYNIPVQTTALPRSLAALGEPKHMNGLMQGVNSHEGVGWAGPHPDAGEPAHHYHFTVYALDRRLDLPPKAERLEVLAAIKGHVLAEGDLVAAFQAPPRKRFVDEQP